ncbi:MAG: hypothetical protein ACAH95_16755 [Fimbriimonas sp.]
MVFGMFAMGSRGSRQSAGDQMQPAVAVQIGEETIPVLNVEQQAQLQLAQQQTAPNPKMEVFAIAQTLDNAVQELANQVVAAEIAPDLSDEAIREQRTRQVDKQIADAKQRYIDEKKLKPTSTAKEFDELFKKEAGATPEEYRKRELDDVNSNLADEAKKESYRKQMAPLMAFEKLKASFNPTDAEVKASYNTLVLKRVMISTANKPIAEAEAQAKKALAEAKGAAKFEDVMNRYSNDLPPGPNKKVGEVVVNLNPSDVAQNPSMAPLMNLKPGQISDVIDVPEGKAFYKLSSLKSSLPADYAKNPQKYKDKLVDERTMAEFRKRTDAIAKSDKVQLPLPGYKALRDYYKTASDFMLMQKPEEFAKRMRTIADAAKAARSDDNPADEHVALITWYAAVDDLWNRAKADPKQAEALRAERLEALQTVLGETENFSIRMDLIDMGIEQKNADLASLNLIEAAKLNNTFDTTGDQHFRDIQTRLAKLKAAKLITAEQATEVEKEQQRWRTEKAANLKSEKEFKVQQEAEKKQQAEATKKFDEEQKKMAEQVKKDLEKNKAPAPKTTSGGQ